MTWRSSISYFREDPDLDECIHKFESSSFHVLLWSRQLKRICSLNYQFITSQHLDYGQNCIH
jgi:hypothetical protein